MQIKESMATIGEQMVYPVHMELNYVLGQTELAAALLTQTGLGAPDIDSYEELMPTQTIPGGVPDN